MFTGLVEETGRVVSFAPAQNAWGLQVAAHTVPAGVAVGDSVAVNGCCLTVTRFDAGNLWFELLEETCRLTSFGELQPGALVNLERSLRADTRMGGHFVSGHIDALGHVAVFAARGKDHYMQVTMPPGSGRYLVPKGSIAVDGISLTVADVADDRFAVWLIPHTLAATNLQEKQAGAAVNLEFDLIAKYTEKLLAARSV